MAGTFDVLHDGHCALIQRAFKLGDEVIVGITSDEMAARGRQVCNPLYLRRQALEEYLHGMGKPWKLFVLYDVYGPRAQMDRVGVLVVSAETVPGAEEINRDRAARGVSPLKIDVVPMVMAADGFKISASAIMAGRYGRDGATGGVSIAVGSCNPVKVEAVREVMEQIFGSVRITAVDVPSSVPEQPFEDMTRTGAVHRAEGAIGDHDLGVGIEAGVFERAEGLYDFQYCAVLDREGRLTVGIGPGFCYPPAVAELVRGGLTVGQAISKMWPGSEVGRQQGAVGLLSDGLLDRKALTRQAVIAAMIPRIGGEKVASHSRNGT